MAIPDSDLKISDRSTFLTYVSELEEVGHGNSADRYERILSSTEADLDRTFPRLSEEEGNLIPNEKATDGDANCKHPLSEARERWITAIEAVRGRWTKSLHAYSQRNDFALRRGKERMICVFGKVKAGKSSLGNFVAYGVGAPTPEIVAATSPRPEFFYETSSGLNEKMSAEIMAYQRCFGIGIAETTSSIQGFSLPGFTWVDTPGVDSVNAANGDLSYQYIDASDLIIFTLNSSSPERASDRAKIISFLRRGKPIILVITASDSIEEDEGPDGELIKMLVMKSDAVRQEQCTRVKAFIESALEPEEAGFYDFAVVSLSARYACEGEGTEQERWFSSGMQGFFTALVRIFLAQGDSVRTKTALGDLWICLEETKLSLDAYADPDTAFAAVIEETLKDVSKSCRNVQADMNAKFPDKIEILAADLGPKKDNTAMRAGMRSALLSVLTRCSAPLYDKFGRHDSRRPRFKFSAAENVPDFHDKFTTMKHESSLGSNIGAAIGSTVGMVGGSFLGGAQILGSAGGALGELAGGLFDGSTEEKVKTGDNTPAVIANAIRQMEVWSGEACTQMETDLKKWIETGTLTSLKLMQSEVSRLKDIVSSNLDSLKKDLDHGNS